MRKGIILGVGMLALVAVFAAILLMPAKPKSAVWKLPNGTSELSLAGVTHGTKIKRCSYGNRLADYLYPVLTPALRKKFNCQVAAVPNVATNSVTLWFWNKGSRLTPSPRRTGSPFLNFRTQGSYAVVAVDENGMESASPPTGSWAWWSTSNLLEAAMLPEFPRRSREIKLRIYNKASPGSGFGELIGEFMIPNPVSTNYPVWAGAIAPVTVETNGLSVSLTKFEAGVPAGGNYMVSGHANSLTRAQVTVFTSQGPLEWHVLSAQAKSATGEHRYAYSVIRPPGLLDMDWAPLPPTRDTSWAVLNFPGTCWLQEPAWKIAIELERMTNFPPEEVWTITGVNIPKLGQINELDLKTNINGGNIEFVGLSADNANWGSGQFLISHSPDYEIKVRSPMRASDKHLQIVGIRDDQGSAVAFTPFQTEVAFTGSYSNNPAVEQSFSLNIPLGAKTIDVKLAYPKSQFVELDAARKPTKAGEHQ